VESAVDLEAAGVQAKKSQMALDTEEELARADTAMDSETLKDTAPVLEGIKVMWITVHFYPFQCKDSKHPCKSHEKLPGCPSVLTLWPHSVS